MMNPTDKMLMDFLDGTLAVAQQKKLWQALKRNPGEMGRVMDYLRGSKMLEYILAGKADDAFVTDVMNGLRQDTIHFVSRIEQDVKRQKRIRKNRTLWLPRLAAAAVFLAFAGWWMVNLRGPQPTAIATRGRSLQIVEMEGLVRDGHGNVLSARAVLQPGMRLQTERDAYVLLAASDGSMIDLAPNTHLTVPSETDPEFLELHAGKIYCQIASREPDQPAFMLRTGAGHRVVALGTAFDVETQPQQTDVRVESGVIALHTSQSSVHIAALRHAAAIGDRITEPRAIQPQAIAAWKFDRLPFADGAVLFEDRFDKDLSGWTIHYLERNPYGNFDWGKALDVRNLKQVSIRKNAGRAAGSSTLQLTNTRSDTVLYASHPPPVGLRGFSVEYDQFLEDNTHVPHYMFRNRQPARVLPVVPESEYAGKPVRGRRWHRYRFEFRYRHDDDGNPCLDSKMFINGSLHNHYVHYPEEISLGIAIREGQARFDNYVMREMTPEIHVQRP